MLPTSGEKFGLELLVRNHAARHSKEYYYKTRELTFDGVLDRAAQFLYLNRTCWNGLYRENLQGKFNVPKGTKDSVIFATDDFGAWAKVLAGADVKCSDFEQAIDDAETGDLVFVDPPYTVRHNLNAFVKYNQRLFAWDDQIRLREALERATLRGSHVVMTNADHESIRELYRGFGNHYSISRSSKIAGDVSFRTATTELLILA